MAKKAEKRRSAPKPEMFEPIPAPPAPEPPPRRTGRISLVLLALLTALAVTFGALAPGWLLSVGGSFLQRDELPLLESTAARRECWFAWQAGKKDANSYDSGISQRDEQKMTRMTQEVLDEFSVDQGAEATEASGAQCVSICLNGGRIRVWHYYRQWRGDWRNWMEMYIDVDTGEVYYFYLSSGCENKTDAYTAMENTHSATELAAVWLKKWGLTVEDITEEDDDGQTVLAHCDDGESSANYSVTWKYYPGSLLDFKINLTN